MIRNRHYFLAGLFIGLLLTAEAWPADLEPMLTFTHSSDPTDGGKSDEQVDFIGGGVTLTFGKRRAFELDGALGRKVIDCYRRTGPCASTPGGFVAVRFYPWRR